mgnify:CR=1 FL=1
MRMRVWLIPIVTLCVPVSTHAALLVEEYFNYGTSDLDSGYGSWNDSTSRVKYSAGVNLELSPWPSGYDPGSNAGTGSLGLVSGTGTPRGAQLDFTTTEVTGEFWISYLVRTDANAANETVITSLNNALYSNGSPNSDGFGLGYDSSNLGIRPVFFDSSTATNTFGGTANLASNTAYLLIAKVVVNTGSGDDDHLTLWVKAAGDNSFGPTEASLGTSDLSTTAASFGTTAGVKNIWVGRYTTAVNGNVDALRISNQGGDAGLAEVLGVIPEPSSLSLLATGLLTLRRRRTRC